MLKPFFSTFKGREKVSQVVWKFRQNVVSHLGDPLVRYLKLIQQTIELKLTFAMQTT